MSVKFRASSTFALRDKKRLMIEGKTIEGTLKPGMKLGIPLNKLTSVTVIVSAVAALCKEGACDTALAIDCETDGELDRPAALNIGDGEILELSDP